MATRTETDSFGSIQVPHDSYWGAQTERSIGCDLAQGYLISRAVPVEQLSALLAAGTAKAA